MPYSGGGGGTVLGSVSTVTGTAAASQVPVASSSSAAAWAYPPGYEISYTQVTASVNVVSTTESSGTTIFSPGALTFDGTLVIVELGGHLFTPSGAAGDQLVVSLFEGATQITRLAVAQTVAASNLIVPMSNRYRFTPSAGSHTYTITAFANVTTGTPRVLAGNGSTGGNPPAFVRFVKV